MSGIPISDAPGSMAERWRVSQLRSTRADAEERSDLAAPGGGLTPARCPTCRSVDLVTTSKVVTEEAYWRCCACGEVWNAGRLRSASRHARRMPFSR